MPKVAQRHIGHKDPKRVHLVTQQKPHKYPEPISTAPIIDLSASRLCVKARVAPSSVAMDGFTLHHQVLKPPIS